MIHQPSGGFQGQATDIEIHAREVLRLKERLNRMLAENTKRPYEDVAKATERDNFLTPDEAKELGIIDRVLVSRRDAAAADPRDGMTDSDSRSAAQEKSE